MPGLKTAPCFALALSLLGAVATAAAPAGSTVIKSVDLSQAFATRSPWRLTVMQGPDIADPLGLSGDKAAGSIQLCLSKTAAGSCDPSLQSALTAGAPADDLFGQPHYLNDLEIVHPHGPAGRALLVVQTASSHSGDGDQAVLTQALAYDAASDRFVRIYEHATGHNNNQAVHYVASGKLEGDIIAVEPAEHAPFNYWVTVNALTPAYTYRQVLRYRSATLYGDGNPLSVSDSELPNIEQRLGLWRPGSPLPLPAGACPKPHLVEMELWCR
jgi:hypothetical protein